MIQVIGFIITRDNILTSQKPGPINITNIMKHDKTIKAVLTSLLIPIILFSPQFLCSTNIYSTQ
jgi:hypothetical protein